MSKPILQVGLQSIEGGRSTARAVFDTGSYYSIVQEAKLPAKTLIHRYRKPETLRTASKGGKLDVTGTTLLIIQIGQKWVRDEVLISPNLNQEMLIGTGTMQKWDISIGNNGGRTRVSVGRDLHDPEVTEVD